MAKPRVFVSSTYYDLKHIRASVEVFVQSLGYEAILFESGDIPFHHDKALDLSCYDAVENAHIFVLIIGGRYGSGASGTKQNAKPKDANEVEALSKMYDFYNSITVEEYKRARQQDIPIYIFLEKGVAAEYQTYRENKDLTGIKYAHVDNVGIFKLVESIYSESRNNLVREFEKFEHITSWLKNQWAGLFADHLAKRKSDSILNDLTSQIQTLNQVVDSLRNYSEAIVRKIEPDASKSDQIIRTVEDKLVQDIINSNPLIRFIKSSSAFTSRPLTVARILKSIAGAHSIDSFCAALGLPQTGQALLRNSRHAALRDLRSLRSQLSEVTQLKSFFENSPQIVENSVADGEEEDIDKKALLMARKLQLVEAAALNATMAATKTAAKPTPKKSLAVKKISPLKTVAAKKVPARKKPSVS